MSTLSSLISTPRQPYRQALLLSLHFTRKEREPWAGLPEAGPEAGGLFGGDSKEHQWGRQMGREAAIHGCEGAGQSCGN